MYNVKTHNEVGLAPSAKISAEFSAGNVLLLMYSTNIKNVIYRFSKKSPENSNCIYAKFISVHAYLRWGLYLIMYTYIF